MADGAPNLPQDASTASSLCRPPRRPRIAVAQVKSSHAALCTHSPSSPRRSVRKRLSCRPPPWPCTVAVLGGSLPHHSPCRPLSCRATLRLGHTCMLATLAASLPHHRLFWPHTLSSSPSRRPCPWSAAHHRRVPSHG